MSSLRAKRSNPGPGDSDSGLLRRPVGAPRNDEHSDCGWGGNLLASAPAHSEIFAGNRAFGRIALSVAAAPDGSRRRRVHEAGALRVRFPNVAGKGALDAVIVNTAGGMTGG